MELYYKPDASFVGVGATIKTQSWGLVYITQIEYPKVTIRFQTGRTLTSDAGTFGCEWRRTQEEIDAAVAEARTNRQPTIWAVAVPLLVEGQDIHEVRQILAELFAGLQHSNVVSINTEVSGISTGVYRGDLE
jgi:hypothetical protein